MNWRLGVERFKSVFQGSVPEALVVCPHCEKPLVGHDEAACSRKMSRRFFFGMIAAPVAIAIAAKLPTLGPDALGSPGLLFWPEGAAALAAMTEQQRFIINSFKGQIYVSNTLDVQDMFTTAEGR